MDLEIIVLSKASQAEKDKYHMISYVESYIHLYNIYYIYVILYTYTHTHTHTNKVYGYPKGNMGWRDKLGIRD